MNLILFRKHGEAVIMTRFILSDDIVKGGRAEEILLLESQFFAGVCGIVGVEDTGDVFGILPRIYSTIVITHVELVEIKVSFRPRSPQSQIVAVVSVEARNGGVVGHGDDSRAILPVSSLGITIPVSIRLTIEPNLIGDILPLDLPGVALSEPKIRNLNLISIYEGLSEDTVLISNTIAPSWNLKGGERIEEACSESSKTTIAEGGIILLLIQFLQIVSHVHQGSLEFIFEI